MIFFDIEGTVFHIFETKQYSARHNEFEIFKKKEIIVETEDDIFTLTFNDDKIELVKDCQVGTKIRAEVKLRGHTWKKDGITYSKNEIRCQKLKRMCSETKLNYQGKAYFLKKYFYEGYLMLKLVSTSDNTEIEFCAVGVYENNKTEHILFHNFHSIEILNLLIENNIVEHLYDIHQNQIASGHVCRVLVMDKFENDILTK